MQVRTGSAPRGGNGRLRARIAGFALAALLAEILLRQLYWIPLEWHPELGFVVPPGTEVRWCAEGCASSRWTVDGIRRAAPPDPARPSILALGDSFTEGFMVGDEDVFTHRLEALLREDGAAWQVLNAGRSGLAAPDYVSLAPWLRQRFAARWTVIELREGDLAAEAFDPGRTHFRVREGGAVEVVSAPRTPSRRSLALSKLRQHVALLNYAVIRGRELAAAAAAEPPLFRAASADGAPPGGTRASREARDVDAQLDALSAAYEGRVTFALLPDFPSVADAGAGPGPVERALERRRAAGTSAVNLRDSFPQFEARFASPYGFGNTRWNRGHLNADGHRALAEQLRAEIERLGRRAVL